MRIAVRFKDDITIVSLSGKFVAGGDGPFLRQKVQDLIGAGARRLLFHFEDVPYIDSTGLGFLAGSRELASEAGAAIVLAGINPHVLRILESVKLTRFFEIVDDEAAGIESLRKTELTVPRKAAAGVPDPRTASARVVPPKTQATGGEE